jgi:hypothetical protein
VSSKETTVLEPDATEPTPKKTAVKKPTKKKATAAAFTPAEVESKLDIVCGLVARISGRDYTYKPSDFKQEAAALVRLSEKFDLVAQGLTLFDPIVIIAGLVAKFMSMAKREKTPKQPTPAPAPAPNQAATVTPINKEIISNA